MTVEPAYLVDGYFVPLVLANGTDFCQVDFTGTLGFKEHIRGYFPFWYRKGRPDGPDPAGLVHLPWQWVTSVGPVEIGASDFSFCPETAVLTTRLSLYRLELSVTTFLNDDHQLVEAYDVLEATDDRAVMRLIAECPGASYTNKPLDSLWRCGAELRFAAEAGRGVMRYRYASAGQAFEGAAVTSVVVLDGTATTTCSVDRRQDPASEGVSMAHDDHAASDRILIELGPLRTGDRFMRITTVMDSLDRASWCEDQLQAHAACEGRSFPDLLERHARSRASYSEASAFQCDADRISRLFAVSMYVCRASLHPGGSSVSALAIPNNHHMGTYWDIWFVHAALLRANRVVAARTIIDFWHVALPAAQRVARASYGVEGARFEWVLRHDGVPAYGADQLHNNVIPVLTIWEQYLYTMDRAGLARDFAIMVEAMRFLAAYALRREAGGVWYLREMISVDESLKRKRNELLTTARMLDGIRVLARAAAVLERSVPDEFAETEQALTGILAGLRDPQAGWQPYEGADRSSWAVPLALLHMTDSDGYAPAMARALIECCEARGWGMGAASRMRCAESPWMAGIMAWAMARHGDARAGEMLEAMGHVTNVFGGLPEYVWLHGEPSREWFVAAHGVFVVVLAELVAQQRGESLTILPFGLDALPWSTCSVDRFRLPGGLLIRVEQARGASPRVALLNDTSEPVTCPVTLAGDSLGHVRFEPGVWQALDAAAGGGSS